MAAGRLPPSQPQLGHVAVMMQAARVRGSSLASGARAMLMHSRKARSRAALQLLLPKCPAQLRKAMPLRCALPLFTLKFAG